MLLVVNFALIAESSAGQTVRTNRSRERAHALHFIRRYVLIAACLLSSLLAGNALARAAAGPHSEVDLVSESSSIAPGRSFWVGLHFKIEPLWHIYWVNPGDSGEPPAVQWNLPRGFRAGQIEWPAPERIKAFTLINYGYQGDVLLPVLMHAAASFKPGSKVNLAATVKWLVCKDECIPAQGQLSLSLPVEKSFSRPSPAARALFERTWVRLPKPAPPGWKVSAVSEQNDFILSIDSGKPESGAIFFPLESEQIKNTAPQEVLVRGRRLRLRLRKSDQLLKPLPVLNGVVVFPSGPALVVHARVEPAPRKAARPSRGT